MKQAQKQLSLMVVAALSSAMALGAEPRDVAADRFENEGAAKLSDVVVTAAPSVAPVKAIVDPKKPVQPIPAADGAGLLKAIPNMSLVRKGGMSSDPQFRGLGGTRLNVLVDDQVIQGGCGGRMDPPTSYVFPADFDSVILTKGPQSVIQGPGLIAGSVLFKKNFHYYPELGFRGDAAVTVGNFGRVDVGGQIEGGLKWGYLRFAAHYDRQGDYKDGKGAKFHSGYGRHNENLAVVLTPSADSAIEFSYDHGRGHAEYADRMMDGAKFDRDAFGIRAFWNNVSPRIGKIAFEGSHNNIDHVMDNYSYRKMVMKDKKTGMAMYRTANPTRAIYSGRIYADLLFGPSVTRVGVDYSHDKHRGRFAMAGSAKESLAKKNAMKYMWNQTLANTGAFVQTKIDFGGNHRIVAGYRFDSNTAEGNPDKNPNVPKNKLKQTHNFHSGFGRYEFRTGSLTAYAGVGVAHRAPDFWDRIRKGGYDLKPETNVEGDVGLVYAGGKVNGSLNVFASRINNFMLLDPDRGMVNVDASRFGFEGDLEWKFYKNLVVATSVAYTYAQNLTMGKPLPRTSPMEFNSRIGYDDGKFSANLVMRNVLEQSRIHKGFGTILGVDTVPSKAFTVFSLNAGWRILPRTVLAGGVDNLLNATYHEFTSHAGAMVDGYNPTNGLTLNEPGRTYWLRLSHAF